VERSVEGVLATLRQEASPVARRRWRARGVRAPALGLAERGLERLARRLGPNTSLALQLFEEDSYDARLLALHLAVPGEVPAKTLAAWIRRVPDPFLADVFAEVAARHPAAKSLGLRWVRSRRPVTRRVGWSVLAKVPTLAARSRRSLLATLEASGATSPVEEQEGQRRFLVAQPGPEAAALLRRLPEGPARAAPPRPVLLARTRPDPE
jgi:hypothetical protein